eukprot:jgi/Galph1/6091/GphlegSOOS_G4697.1
MSLASNTEEKPSSNLTDVSEIIEKFGGRGTYQGPHYIGNTVSAKAKRFEKLSKGEKDYMEQQLEKNIIQDKRENLLHDMKNKAGVKDIVEKFGGGVKRECSDTNYTEENAKAEKKPVSTVKELAKKFSHT